MSAEGRGCPVEIMNPLVAEQTEMRRSLIPALLQAVEYNITHSTANVQLYEIGTLFFGRENASADVYKRQIYIYVLYGGDTVELNRVDSNDEIYTGAVSYTHLRRR